MLTCNDCLHYWNCKTKMNSGEDSEKDWRVCGEGNAIHQKVKACPRFKEIGIVEVVNQKNDRGGMYIGRGTPLGNPFVIGKDGTRTVVINKYEKYFAKKLKAGDPKICEILIRIAVKLRAGKLVKLRCHCKPKRCHGDVVKKVAEKLSRNKPLMVELYKGMQK